MYKSGVAWRSGSNLKVVRRESAWKKSISPGLTTIYPLSTSKTYAYIFQDSGHHRQLKARPFRYTLRDNAVLQSKYDFLIFIDYRYSSALGKWRWWWWWSIVEGCKFRPDASLVLHYERLNGILALLWLIYFWRDFPVLFYSGDRCFRFIEIWIMRVTCSYQKSISF